MEDPNKEKITETTVFEQGANHNESAATENADNNIEISANIESTTSDTLLAIKPINEELSCAVGHNSSETSLEIANDKIHETAIESSAGDFEPSEDESSRITQQPEIVSEITEVTEKYQENISISQREEKVDQTTECVSEFVLEKNTEKVYISEVQDMKLQSSEQVHLKTNLPDNTQVIDTSDQVDQQNTTALTELTETEINQTNLIDYSAEDRVDNENCHLESANDNQSDKNGINDKHVKIDVNSESENVVEKENQNIDEHIGNEESVHENMSEVSVEDIVIENVEESTKDSGEGYQYNVKQEMNSIEVVQSDSVINKEQEIDNINESVVHEHEEDDEVVESVNDEIVENVDLPNVSTVSSENLSVEGYTIAERMEVTEIQGEYTIVEGPNSLDISTNSLEESGSSNQTWVLLQNHENSEDSQLETFTEDQNEVYLSEMRSEAESGQSVSSQSSENKPRRGRKPTYDIPMHVLGHDISKPVESVPNGRALPKPRLGVKVPYRNLTSQIVSKAEIEKEVMERARLKQEQVNSRADILFARKLTQRLARKIAPSPEAPKKLIESKKSRELSTQIQRKETEIVERKENENQNQDNSKIHNDSDLLAILEGEGDEMPVLPKEVPQPQVDDSNLKMLEREIALQQLQELPHQAPKHRIYRGRQVKADGKAPVLIPEASISLKSKATNKSEVAIKESSILNQKLIDDQPINVLSDKENDTTRQPVSKDIPSVSPKRDQASVDTLPSPKKQPIEIEPQVKVNMVLKTYSRKRKTIEMPEALADSPLPKKTMLAEGEIKLEKTDSSVPSNVYVTKSSRVIKKKVIWDPDEAPIRSPKSITKVDVQSPKITTVKVTRPIEKITNVEKIPEKKAVNEKMIKEKFEKRSTEKVPLKKNVGCPSDKKIIVSKADILKGKTPIKGKKIRSEVDKLLMDEGAVKMLYELKNNDEAVPKKKKDVYSVEKAHKDIMKKANEIKSDLQQNTSNESPKSLRKKESFTPSPVKPAQITCNTERKMSKDSTRSSLHTPPGSPAYSFPHSQSSMLIRRRSSSSISSSDEVDENDVSKTSRKKLPTASPEAPKSKKVKKNESKEPSEKLSEVKDPPEKPAATENKFSYKSFTVKKTSKQVTIDMNYNNEKCHCTVQVSNRFN